MTRPANAGGYPGQAWLWYTLVRPLLPVTVQRIMLYVSEL